VPRNFFSRAIQIPHQAGSREKNMAVKTITGDNFETEVLQNKGTVLVDFWASWCGPCRMLSPVVDQVAEEQSALTVGKVNVDEQPALADRFQVMTIPTLIVFRNGEAVRRSSGVIPKEEILDMLR